MGLYPQMITCADHIEPSAPVSPGDPVPKETRLGVPGGKTSGAVDADKARVTRPMYKPDVRSLR
jgi:hypothetical protein